MKGKPPKPPQFTLYWKGIPLREIDGITVSGVDWGTTIPIEATVTIWEEGTIIPETENAVSDKPREDLMDRSYTTFEDLQRESEANPKDICYWADCPDCGKYLERFGADTGMNFSSWCECGKRLKLLPTPKPNKKPPWDIDQILADAHRVDGEYKHNLRKYRREMVTQGTISVPAALVVELIETPVTREGAAVELDRLRRENAELKEGVRRQRQEIVELRKNNSCSAAAADPIGDKLREIVGRVDVDRVVEFIHDTPREGTPRASIFANGPGAQVVADLITLLMSLKEEKKDTSRCPHDPNVTCHIPTQECDEYCCYYPDRP